MKKDNLFRVVNGIGFAANAASICMPYHSVPHVLLKMTSGLCNLTSAWMAMFSPGSKNTLIAATSYMCFQGDNTLTSANFNPETEHHPARYFYESASMGTQFLNMRYGLDKPAEKPTPFLF